MKNFMYNEVERCFQFAKGMRNNHLPDFPGYKVPRRPEEIFYNDIQGKLAEIAVRKTILSYPNVKINGELDFGIYERGIWDSYDMIVNGQCLSIKSIKHFSVVLMIECSRFNANGQSSYLNNDGSKIKNDFYILTKIKIEPKITKVDLDKTFEQFKTAYSDYWEKDVSRQIEYEVIGGISHHEFWKRKKLLPAGTIITRKNMDAYLLENCDIRKLPDKKGEVLKVDNWAVHINNLSALDVLGFLR